MKTYSPLAIGPVGIPELIVMLVVMAMLAFWIWALVDCWKQEREPARSSWFVFILFTSFVGSTAYFFGRHLNRK